MALSGWGNSIYIEHGSAAALDNMTVGTMAFWCQTTSTGRMNLWGKVTNSTTEFWEAVTGEVFCAKPRATTWCSTRVTLSNLAHWGTNKWVFVVWSYDTVTGGNNKFYVGDLSNSAAEPSSYVTQSAGSGTLDDDSGNNWLVGRRHTANNREWVGPIATHFVFNKVLTLSEVVQLQWTGRIADWAACLIATEYGYTGATATQPDWSGNANAGTVTGSPTITDHVPKRPPFGWASGWEGAFTASAGGLSIPIAAYHYNHHLGSMSS